MTSEALPTRAGVTIELSSLDPGASRSALAAALQKLEAGLRADGWVRVVADQQLTEHTHAMYESATALLADADASAALRREHLVSQGEHLALTYLGDGEEPLYDPAASKQRVRSLNIHEVLSPAECDARLPAIYDEEERALAHAYHSAVLGDNATDPLLQAAGSLRATLTRSVCAPLLRAFALLLGLDEAHLAARCRGQRSDNTSMLRALEYPQRAAAAAADGNLWGVSAHTDFELFSLLHEQCAGLQLCDPSGAWHEPGRQAAEASSWILIAGDMLARLSSCWLLPTPHRVRATATGAAAPRRSLVFFQALDEMELVVPVDAAHRRRSRAPSFRRMDEGDERHETAAMDEEQRRLLLQPAPLTQREWQDLKEAAARGRLRDAG